MSSRPFISAIICTHNPRAGFLNRVLAALAAQTLPRSQWDLVVVDSASASPIAARTDLQLPPDARLVRLDQPGLAIARKAGAAAAQADLLAFVDDDTVFSPDYLQAAVDFMAAHPAVASCCGIFEPDFEKTPPAWLGAFHSMLGLRNLGPDTIITPGLQPGGRLTEFPHAAPIGVCVCRRPAYDSYLQRWSTDQAHASLGRSGKSLASGEDNDFALCCLEAGWSVAYTPALRAVHVMPAERLEPAYLARLSRASSRTWVQLLALHGMCPRPPISPHSVRLRQTRAWFTHRAWTSPAAYIRWQAACGQFEGLALLGRK